MGCHPVAVVILHAYKIGNWLLLNLSQEGCMRSMQWQLGILGTISAFAYRHRETEKTLCRGGRSQDLPSTDFQPAVRQAGSGRNCSSVLILLASQSADLHDIYHCCVSSEKLLMMDRGTVRNMQSFIPKINLRNQCIWLVLL